MFTAPKPIVVNHPAIPCWTVWIPEGRRKRLARLACPYNRGVFVTTVVAAAVCMPISEDLKNLGGVAEQWDV